MKNKEYFKDFDNFDEESQQILKQAYDNKQILNIKDISDEIGKTIQKTIPNETSAQDNYTEDFYGLKSDEGIRMPDLIEFIRKANSSVKFDWTQFKAQQGSMSFPNPYGFSTEVKLSGNIPFSYTNEKGGKVQTNITGLLNKKVDYIDDAPYFSLNIDPKAKYLNCSLIYFYQNTAQYRQEIPLTASKTDFTINNKYKAVQFNSNNLDDLAHLAKKLENDNTWFKGLVNKYFLPLLRKENTVDGLIFLYRSSPDWVLQNLTAEELWAHLNTFFNYDENHGFKDASDVLVKTLLGYNTVEKLTFLFDKLNADQAFIKRIYSALDGNAVFQGQEMPTKTIFSSFLVSLCYMNMAKCRIRNKVFKVGKNYKINSNFNPSNDEFKDRYFLQQQQIQQQNVKVVAKEGNPNATEDVEVNLDAGNYYYPLELVTLEDVSETTEPEAKNTKTQKAELKKMLVPAIFVKDIAHLTEFKEITDNVRLGVDLIVLALSVASLGSSSPLVVLVSAVDAAIAGGDILVMMNEDKFSKEFLDTWNLVVMAGGAGTAAPFLMKGLFRAGALVLTSAGRAEVMTFVKTCLMKAMLELNISNFTKNTLKVLEPKEVFLGRKYLAMGNRMAENGVIFLGGVKEGKYAESFAAVYKGEVIEEFSKAELSKFYKKWGKLQEKELIKELEHAGGHMPGSSIVETTDAVKIKAFEEGAKQFSKTIAKPFEKIKEAMPYFNHKSVGDAVKQVGKYNCGNTVEVLVEFLRTGKLRVAEPSGMQSLDEVALKFGGGHFQPSKIPRMEQLMAEEDIVVVYGIKEKNSITGSTKGHYFVGMKKDKKLHLFDGQTGEYVVFAQTREYGNFIQRGYLEFKYLKVR